jgi:hypothetical protein
VSVVAGGEGVATVAEWKFMSMILVRNASSRTAAVLPCAAIAKRCRGRPMTGRTARGVSVRMWGADGHGSPVDHA